MPFILASHLYDILFVRLLNAGLPWMASARGLADAEPVASVTHRLPCKTVCLCHLRGDGSGVVHGWSGSGTGMERGLERKCPLRHSTATVARLYQIRKFRAEAMQQAILRLQAGSS